MDSLNASFRQFNDGRFEERWEALREETLNDPRVRSFLNANPELKGTPAENRLNELYQYKNQWLNCDQCPGLEACPNLIQGYQPELKIYRGDIQLQYHPCSLKRKADEQKRQASFIQSLYIPKEMTEVSFDDFHEDNQSRMKAYTSAMQFCAEVDPGNNGRGLYIHGPFGVGKTFLVGAIANELADAEITTMIVYAPDFFRELKNGISDGSYQDKLDHVKRAPLLILDDIGAETMSNWVRDDILGAMLQFRMMEKLPTIFTSNFDLDELEMHFASTQRGGVEKVDQLKAKRIMERIRHLNDVIDMAGENKRELNN
ncbi:primosomal protein DnaI [Salisediminibacterium halotolerans]|uniref:Primosomal protein DnaI n=1 Tax=Salisediminibacterium halotolerans TaxID=517425 RepID=A0A1H9U118_9BACI|nr:MULTISPECIES: primosomal protein DnaI [Salisediminibacterium]RLJ80860.1 replicative DNA helicase loader DnaI [Actinophytocola xinjiangensis]RPE84041.1 replicative DNA helicase loader DnaI [Salisediminibacterium halotolerans]TWG37807.1 replicative DNA helicase loader DnaI [Salisediminibacterium halotolerans]SES02844.1 primosomal protein DnaI [Salisediminibacterium haloalkalitolerans]GEL08559.1 primosomal protein DnaI [Salisediminibacterium halotolerans]